MEENKTKELINVFSNTYELICQAAYILKAMIWMMAP